MARGSMRERTGPTGKAYELRVYVDSDPDTGRPRYRTKTVRGCSHRQAERHLAALVREVDEGRHTAAGPDATLGQLLDQWVALRTPKWSPKTLLETQGYIRRNIRPHLGDERLHRVTPKRLDDFYVRLQADGLSAATVRRVHSIVRAALEQAVRWDWLLRNPAARTDEIAVPAADVHPPSPEDLKALLAHVATRDRALYLYLRLAAVTGRRRGELCALRWTDVDLDAATVVIARTVVESAAGLVERPISKNRHRFPPLALDVRTVQLLREYRTDQRQALADMGHPCPSDMWVFARWRDRHGAVEHPLPWSPPTISHRFKHLRDELGLDRIRLHDLRHFAATTMLDGGIAPPTAGGRLGHGDGGRTTQQKYAHFMPATDQAAAELLASRID